MHSTGVLWLRLGGNTQWALADSIADVLRLRLGSSSKRTLADSVTGVVLLGLDGGTKRTLADPIAARHRTVYGVIKTLCGGNINCVHRPSSPQLQFLSTALKSIQTHIHVAISKPSQVFQTNLLDKKPTLAPREVAKYMYIHTFAMPLEQ